MNILITGASGLIGRALVEALKRQGHQVLTLHRAQEGRELVKPYWDWENGRLELEAGTVVDAAIHLAGENIAGRWTAEKKARLYHSRVGGTRFLSESLARLEPRPKVLLAASAVGYYGNRREDWLDERSEAGTGFLPALCRDWEAATLSASQAGVRVVHLRFGLVLAKEGGALARMLPVFRWGLGGKVGDGRQYWSWISIDDVVSGIEHLLGHTDVEGAVNLVSPNAVTNQQFTELLARVLGRPAFFRVPRLMVQALFGEMGRETLLASARVSPQRLEKTGYTFKHPEFKSALRALIGDPSPRGKVT